MILITIHKTGGGSRKKRMKKASLEALDGFNS